MSRPQSPLMKPDEPGPFFFPLPLAAEVTAPSLDGIEMQLADAGRYSPRKTAGC